MSQMISDVTEIVESGLCIGCGLCQSVAGKERLRIVMTPEGRERPLVHVPLDTLTVNQIAAVCPGTPDSRLACRFVGR